MDVHSLSLCLKEKKKRAVASPSPSIFFEKHQMPSRGTCLAQIFLNFFSYCIERIFKL